VYQQRSIKAFQSNSWNLELSHAWDELKKPGLLNLLKSTDDGFGLDSQSKSNSELNKLQMVGRMIG